MLGYVAISLSATCGDVRGAGWPQGARHDPMQCVRHRSAPRKCNSAVGTHLHQSELSRHTRWETSLSSLITNPAAACNLILCYKSLSYAKTITLQFICLSWQIKTNTKILSFVNECKNLFFFIFAQLGAPRPRGPQCTAPAAPA